MDFQIFWNMTFEDEYSSFLDISKKIPDHHTPWKQKHSRGNHLPFMNKTLSKEMQQTTTLKNNFLKDRTD